MSLRKGTQPSAKISCFHEERGFLERVLGEQSTSDDDQSRASQIFPSCLRIERAPFYSCSYCCSCLTLVYAETVSGPVKLRYRLI